MTKYDIYKEIKSILLESSTENQKWFDAFVQKYGDKDGIHDIKYVDSMKLGVVEARLEELAVKIFGDIQKEVIATR